MRNVRGILDRQGEVHRYPCRHAFQHLWIGIWLEINCHRPRCTTRVSPAGKIGFRGPDGRITSVPNELQNDAAVGRSDR